MKTFHAHIPCEQFISAHYSKEIAYTIFNQNVSSETTVLFW